MSYILEALRKSQQQREIGSVPSLASAHRAAPSEPVRHIPVWGVAAVALAGTALLVALYVALRPSAPPPAAATTEPRAETTAAAPPPAAAMPAVPAAAAAAQLPVAPVMMVPVQQLPYMGPVAMQAPYPGSVTYAPAPLPQTASAPFEGDPLPYIEPLPADEPAFAPAPSDHRHVPLLSQMSASERQGVPDYAISIHIFSEDPGARFVYLNGTKYRQGERTREGGRVEAITPAGAVVSHSGVVFRLQL